VATTNEKNEKKGGFGEHLRREREMRGISLEEIASATRISTRFLEALDNEQWSLLPGGVFNRGFVRSVAHHLGLDEEALLAEYTLATGDAPASTGSSVRNAFSRNTSVRNPSMRDPMEESNRGPWVAGILIVVVIAAIGFGGWYLWHRHAMRKNAPVVGIQSGQIELQHALRRKTETS
jgi:cytoskeleton protein RodZ